MSTSVTRRISAVAVIVVAAGLLVSSPASARPLTGSEAASSTLSAKRALDCPSLTSGVLPDNHLVQRLIGNEIVKDEVSSTRALPFRPIASSFFSSKQVTGGVDNTLLMLDPKGSPRLVTLKIRNDSDRAKVSTTKLLNPRFPARLYTGSGGFHVFTVSKSGILKRWTTFENLRGRIYFDDPVTLRKGLKDVRTLAFHSRVRIDNKRTDVLYATTKNGALQQIRVPVGRPTQEKIVTVKRNGFSTTTGLSLSACNGKMSYVSIIAINAADDEARWFTLSKATTPRAKNLTSRGAMASDVSWRIRATL